MVENIAASMVLDIAASYVSLYSMPSGRRVHLGMGVHQRALARELPEIAHHASLLVTHDRRTVELELQRRTARRGIYGPGTPLLDNLLDRTLGGVDSYLEAQIRLHGPEHARGRTAVLLREAMFPEGVAGITRLSYVQQCVAVDVMLRRLQTPELAEAVAALPEMGGALERVRTLNDAYRVAIDDEKRRVPTGEEVRAAQVRGQELLASLLIVILAHFLTRAPRDRAGLTYMLEPIVKQNEAVRLARQRRRVPVDVDPDTGEEILIPDEDDGLAGDGVSVDGLALDEVSVDGIPGAIEPAL